MFVIDGKIALITGGASGIGLHYAKELLRNGLRACTIADINEDYGRKAVEEISNEFGDNRVLFVKTDVANKTQFDEAFKITVREFKNIDILINNAGIMNDSNWEKQILVNLNGTVHGCLLGLEDYFPKYKSGSEALIVNISSIGGLDPLGVVPIYAATKHAIIGLSRSLAMEANYKRTQVRILTICPGLTITNMIEVDNYESLTLTPAYAPYLEHDCQNLIKQPPEFLAKSVIRIIKEGSNGSVWLIENELPAREIVFTDRNNRKK